MLGRSLGIALALALLLAACSGRDTDTHTTATGGSGGAGGSGGTGGTGGSGGVTGTHSTTTSTGTHSTTTSHSTTTTSTHSTTTSTSGAGGASDCEVLGVPGNCIDTAACDAIPDHAPTPHLCPGPTNIQCCTPYGTALCDPAVIVYPNDGHITEAPGAGGCPAGMILVATALPSGTPAFCIDKYEASLVDATTGESWSPYINPGTASVLAVSVEGAVPQGYIDGVQAEEACTLAGKRLCENAEWLRACQGPSHTTYPYGDTRMTGVCNDHRSVHPAVEYFGTSASWIWSEIDNACIDQLPQTVDPAGARSGCVTAEGALDMMGNLHEWTADPNGTFRGGYYVDTVINGNGCLYATTAHNTSHWDYSTGFRCCAAP